MRGICFVKNEEDLSVLRDTGMLADTQKTLLPGSGVDLQRFQVSPLPSYGLTTFIMIARLLGDKGAREYAETCRAMKADGLNV